MKSLQRKGGTEPQTVSSPLLLKAVSAALRETAAQPSSLWLCIDLAQPAEHIRLKALADWAYRYSPRIVIEPPRAVLLEIGASLKLFGGIQALRERIETALAARDIAATIAISPTLLGSRWLAECGQACTLMDIDRLRSALAPLPVRIVNDTLLPAFMKLGIRTLCDLWRLPRAGLARRFGRELLQRLDAALGVAPDVRTCHAPTPRYHCAQDIPDLQDLDRLLPAVRGLLERIVEQLRLRDQAMGRLDMQVLHAKHASTDVSIRLRQASRNVERLYKVLRTRLERVSLPAAVIRIHLEACDVEPFAPAPATFFSYDAAQRHALLWNETLERLEARLGRNALHRLSEVSDHRPEYAWTCKDEAEANSTKTNSAHRIRPLWLLPSPRRLSESPFHQAGTDKLDLISGAERIEGGWWMDQDLRRDYYIARTAAGNRLWIYHDLYDDDWYLHGYFA